MASWAEAGSQQLRLPEAVSVEQVPAWVQASGASVFHWWEEEW